MTTYSASATVTLRRRLHASGSSGVVSTRRTRRARVCRSAVSRVGRRRDLSRAGTAVLGLFRGGEADPVTAGGFRSVEREVGGEVPRSPGGLTLGWDLVEQGQGWAGEQQADVVAGHGLGVEEALGVVAANVGDLGVLLSGFDAFGGDAQP